MPEQGDGKGKMVAGLEQPRSQKKTEVEKEDAALLIVPSMIQGVRRRRNSVFVNPLSSR